ncbi:hypothetical protein [Bifidobacterium avesanii]|uniref:Uncharacterized protein n=1 Tax=Bifidobacterium avesanii TaxID=1798157 RepID=A0A7K3TJ91_9BIFI|nr:hypothetical protein [Bifidobacterium avesanii]KAB8291012.1 hypothetical protein DSM100685_1274 [Bifidobacterium avesanii]NEG78779.1 hypothetical protein [Bifidobacterium avesanii]
MAGRKKDKSLIYWSMNYRGKQRRTWVMLPICIILCIVAPFYTANEYGSVVPGIVFGLILIATWVGQYLYNRRKIEEGADDEPAQQPQPGPQQPLQPPRA